MVITAPLFPLPNIVFFPKTNLPLHVFESRYRQLMRDALNGDQRIAVGLLQPGWEKDYYGNPPVYAVCCVGHIHTFEELEDGKFNLILTGEQKIRIRNVIKDSPYRTISGMPLIDKLTSGGGAGMLLQRQQLLALGTEYFRLRATSEMDLSELQKLDYETLVNSLAAHLGFPIFHKQQLLELDDLMERGKQVARFLQLQIQEQGIIRKFQHLAPKDPSLN
ncbi:MAG TPA: LON peptidase substrate-binding domain-containing protein [Acidobacteriota bacterium]|jgi:hypothetical protein|nr:LON peptidase substrate-binding domain-containing protein [Acidobacteriota bacterium]